jgi:hypothetical protein
VSQETPQADPPKSPDIPKGSVAVGQREATPEENRALVESAREGEYLPYERLEELRHLSESSQKLTFNHPGWVGFELWVRSLIRANETLSDDLRVERERANLAERDAGKAETRSSVAESKLAAETDSTHTRTVSAVVGSVVLGFTFTAYDRAGAPGVAVCLVLGAVLLWTAFRPHHPKG